jgi:hypothetical protein
MNSPLTDERLKELLAACVKATPVEPQDLISYEHGGGRLAILRDGKRQLIADFYGDGEDRDHYANCDPATISSLIQELLSLRQKDGEMVEALSGLASMAADKRLELGFHQKVYGDDDDEPTHGKWVIWREIGNINDREWEVVATGTTPSDALAALSQRSAE